MSDRFGVERIDPMRFDGPDVLGTGELISPYVWRQADDSFSVLFRVMPPLGSDDGCTGRIWYQRNEDGLSSGVDVEPVLVPSPDAEHRENPTVGLQRGELIVSYTGIDKDDVGSLLWASSPDIRSLRKQGVALKSFVGEVDVGEAEIAVQGDPCTIGYHTPAMKRR